MRGKLVTDIFGILTGGLIPAHAGKTYKYRRQTGNRRAHPRACGENSRIDSNFSAVCGSSPRMRGKLAHSGLGTGAARLIPAHAGKTYQLVDALRRAGGSSPRMRGKRGRLFQTSLACRLIPAHAGKTFSTNKRDTSRRAHPRACGENAICDIDPVAQEGSSPRMRGKHHPVRFPGLGCRLIPAHAGKTAQIDAKAAELGAHPRACGENVARSTISMGIPGSSPRMRGKPCRHAPSYTGSGLIPAHAGKTLPALERGYKDRAHPRACGENARASSWIAWILGSSPRMRGKQTMSFLKLKTTGLIPAHAGKTCPPTLPGNTNPAHPRACGENVVAETITAAGGGSSPRMRGKPLRQDVFKPARGLIPAHAGKTPARAEATTAPGAHPRACGENAYGLGALSSGGGSSPRMRGKH